MIKNWPSGGQSHACHTSAEDNRATHETRAEWFKLVYDYTDILSLQQGPGRKCSSYPLQRLSWSPRHSLLTEHYGNNQEVFICSFLTPAVFYPKSLNTLEGKNMTFLFLFCFSLQTFDWLHWNFDWCFILEDFKNHLHKTWTAEELLTTED